MAIMGEVAGLYELDAAAEAELASSPLWNRDLAPTKIAARSWNLWHLAALWVGMAVCIPTYQLAGGLVASGMNWWQAVVTIAIGNLIVLIPMVLNAHAGTRYGVPFPVLIRSSFGWRGANVPSMLRALVACGWFGVQTWIGGLAIYQVLLIFWPDIQHASKLPIGITGHQLACFLGFWVVNVYFIIAGTESIKWLETLAAPFLIAMGLALLAWAWVKAGGVGPMLDQPSRFESREQAIRVFALSLTGMVGFWATLSLNIPDFARFAKSQRDQALGQALGLPTTMGLYSFIGVAVTSATLVIFGETVWDPLEIVRRSGAGTILISLALIAVSVATLTTNIAANVVAPANSFSNLAPSRIGYRAGGLITAAIGVVMCPWFLLESSEGYIYVWLVGYSGLLGPIAGVMIADYFVVKRGRIDLADLYRPNGAYRFSDGVNWTAIGCLIAGILPNMPGFVIQAGKLAVDPASPVRWFSEVYNFAWFVGFGIAFAGYAILGPRPKPRES